MFDGGPVRLRAIGCPASSTSESMFTDGSRTGSTARRSRISRAIGAWTSGSRVRRYARARISLIQPWSARRTPSSNWVVVDFSTRRDICSALDLAGRAAAIHAASGRPGGGRGADRQPPGESASLSMTPRYSLAMAIDRSTRSRTFWPVVVTALSAVGIGAVLGLGLVEAAVRTRVLVFADGFGAGNDNVWLLVFAMTMWLGAVAAAVAGPAGTALTRAIASRRKRRDVEPAAGTEPGRAASVSALVAGAVGAAAAIPLVYHHAAAARDTHIVELRPSPSAVLAYVTGLVLGLAVALAAELRRRGRAASVGLGVAAARGGWPPA